MDKFQLLLNSVEAFIQKIEHFSGKWEIVCVEPFDPQLCFRLWIKENYLGFLIDVKGDIVAKDLKTLIWRTGHERYENLLYYFVIFDDFDIDTNTLKLRVFEPNKDTPLLKACSEFGHKLVGEIIQKIPRIHTLEDHQIDAIIKEQIQNYFENL